MKQEHDNNTTVRISKKNMKHLSNFAPFAKAYFKWCAGAVMYSINTDAALKDHKIGQIKLGM